MSPYKRPVDNDNYSPVNTAEGVYSEPLFFREPNAMGEEFAHALKVWVWENWSLFSEGGDGSYRSDWEIPGVDSVCPLIDRFFKRLHRGVDSACRTCGVDEFEIDWIEANAVGFLDAQGFDWHTDHFQSSRLLREETRTINFLYYFMDEPHRFTGGELEFFDGTMIKPENDLLLWIDPYQRHRVRKVQCEDQDPLAGRWSIAGWLHRKPVGDKPTWHLGRGAAVPINDDIS